jgi:hypothetical protein
VGVQGVAADDVREVVAAAVGALYSRRDSDWSVPAGDLEWTCWETAEHIADDLFAYAAQLAGGVTHRYVPFVRTARRPGADTTTMQAETETGPDGLFEVLTSCGGLLAAVVAVTPPDVRACHTFGLGDAEAFAAMGVLETAVHTGDIARGLGVTWRPDDDVCARVLARLMPEIEIDEAGAWETLRWATGRTDLPGRPHRTRWRWHNEPS